MYKKTALFFLLIALFVWQSCSQSPVSEVLLPAGNTARIIFVVGDVSYKRMDEDIWERASVDLVIEQGTRIRTGSNSYCELVIGSGAIFRMKDRSELQLIVLPDKERNARTLLILDTGELFVKIGKVIFKTRDKIQTNTVMVEAHGTEFLVDAGERAETEVLVKEGQVRLHMIVERPEVVPRDLKPVLRKIDRGVTLKEGNGIAVTGDRVSTLEERIAEIAEAGSAESVQIDALKQEVGLEPEALDDVRIKKLEEVDVMSLEFEQGPAFSLSPDFDGVQDAFQFSTEPFRKEKLHGWRMVFLDGQAAERKVLWRVAEEDEEMRLPDHIVWNLVGADGHVVEDGNYVYEFYTTPRNGGYRSRVRGTIEVDTVPPFLQLSASEMMFSPNGDGIKDTISIEIQAEPFIEWLCTIATSEEIIVKTIEWGEDIPELFEWDGRGINGSVLPEGVYNITVSGQDRAGNRTQKAVEGLTIDVRERQATVKIDNSIFSPNGDGFLDTLTFFPLLSDMNRIDTWDLIVQSEMGDTARRIRGRRYMPRSIKWDGRPQAGKMAETFPQGLPSGVYTYFMKIIYRSGVNTYSFKKQFLLDTDPPSIEVRVDPVRFSPDGDGLNDVLTIMPDIEDISGIAEWKGSILTAEGECFKTFQGTGAPAEEITWDGISDSGRLVDSGEDYAIHFEAVDLAGNRAVGEPEGFSIDILVVQTERGLKIRVSNIEFAHNTAELTGVKTYSIMSKIVKVLGKYEKYSIVIEGHTDSTGDEEYNLLLSKRRAASVGNYLIENGIDPDRLSYKGYGSKYPIDTNETEEGKERNRRVEFLLERK